MRGAIASRAYKREATVLNTLLTFVPIAVALT
jgi:hypothetical protein